MRCAAAHRPPPLLKRLRRDGLQVAQLGDGVGAEERQAVGAVLSALPGQRAELHRAVLAPLEGDRAGGAAMARDVEGERKGDALEDVLEGVKQLRREGPDIGQLVAGGGHLGRRQALLEKGKRVGRRVGRHLAQVELGGAEEAVDVLMRVARDEEADDDAVKVAQLDQQAAVGEQRVVLVLGGGVVQLQEERAADRGAAAEAAQQVAVQDAEQHVDVLGPGVPACKVQLAPLDAVVGQADQLDPHGLLVLGRLHGHGRGAAL